jgi:polyphenol oxidase
MTDETRPKPNDGFAWVQDALGPMLVASALAPFADHFFTTRAWPIGSAEDGAAVDGWADIARAMRLDPAALVRVRQVHGHAALVVRPGDAFDPASLREADIIVSNDPSRAIAIQTADCVPLLLIDRRTGSAGAAHAGWRGLAARVPDVAVATMASALASRPEDLVAVIGPSISWCCYEVAADVRDAFARAGFAEDDLARWFASEPRPTPRNPSMRGLGPLRADRWYFDGWGVARHQLESAGVPRDQIHVAELCSASHPASLCSYRRDGKGAGRMAAAIRPR